MANFEERVRTDFYEKLVTQEYTENREKWREQGYAAEQRFRQEAEEFAIDQGVPNVYAGRAVSQAWEGGHASGYYEVLNCLYGLIDIFKIDGKSCPTCGGEGKVRK